MAITFRFPLGQNGIWLPNRRSDHVRAEYKAEPTPRMVASPPPGYIADSLTYVRSIVGGNFWREPAARNPVLDTNFDCYARDRNGTAQGGVLYLTSYINGAWANVIFNEDSTDLEMEMEIVAVLSRGTGTVAEPADITISLLPNDAYIPFASAAKLNWVKWSDIGSMSFEIGRGNVAGERPLDWPGYVYDVRKLNGKVVVYGQNGVSLLIPANTVFGLNTIYPTGLKGRFAICGDDKKHFFIDRNGQLWKISEGMKLYDFSEYLASLNSSVVMSYDYIENVIYMCDGFLGYVFDCTTENLGKCPPNITGLSYKNGVQYVTASSVISTDPFEITTDIYDMGTRVGKTIFELEFGTDVISDLYAAIDWRRDKSAVFTSTSWHKVSPGGKARIPAYGREFRIKAKLLTYEYFELDYIKVNGVADAY